MMDGGLAIAIVIIVGFALFIVWAKSASGRSTLRSTLGEPHSLRKRQRTTKRRATTTSATPHARKTTKR